ncbi:MAG TPA: mechanosensitive ion channel family protein [Solirubrobacteraceae bacterium]|nr:mechanosensitive ion channel family protein [Solirubrobacteraceae bacterium]
MPRAPQLPKTPSKMFETRSQAWQEVGLLHQISPRAAKRARVEGLVLAVLFVAIVVLYDHRESLFGLGKAKMPGADSAVQIATVIVLLILGWAIARDAGQALGPALFRRMDPATAGTVGFLIRLATIVLALLVGLSVAGVEERTLALGGAFTAVILGLAAQQTLGNLIAGTVLLSARPFRVGDHIRLQGGPLAGQIEGVVSSLGLLYTTFATGDGSVLVPNSVVLNVALHTGKGRLGDRSRIGRRVGEAGGGEPEDGASEGGESESGAPEGGESEDWALEGGETGYRAPPAPPTR